MKLLVTTIASLLLTYSSLAADMDFRGPEKMSASETSAIKKIEDANPGMLFYKAFKNEYFIFLLHGFDCPIWINEKATQREALDAIVAAYWAYEAGKQSMSETEPKK